MSGPAPHRHAPSRAGLSALAFGALSLLCSLVPVVGDLVSVPLALIAIVCGVRGVGHYDSGRAPRLMPALLGALLGGISLLTTVVAAIAMS